MPHRPLLLGHRGARATTAVPENTFASFDLALQHGCDGFEFDVRGTADGRAVICHDAEFAGLEVAASTWEELLEGWNSGILPKLLFAEPAQLPREALDLPALEAVLAAYSATAFLDIELKVAGLESLLLSALANNPPQRGYVVSSFLPEVLERLHADTARIPLGFLCDTKTQLAQWARLPVEHVIAHHTLVRPELIEAVHTAGRKLFVWTVNDRKAMLRLAEWGADAIISDDTRLLVETLRTQ